MKQARMLPTEVGSIPSAELNLNEEKKWQNTYLNVSYPEF